MIVEWNNAEVGLRHCGRGREAGDDRLKGLDGLGILAFGGRGDAFVEELHIERRRARRSLGPGDQRRASDEGEENKKREGAMREGHGRLAKCAQHNEGSRR